MNTKHCAVALMLVLLAASPLRAANGAYVVGRGAHSRIIQTVSTDARGRTVASAYVEMEGGMHYWDNGQWQETQERFEVHPEGAVAKLGPHKVILSPNLHTLGAVDLLTSDNKRLRSHVLGLCYLDVVTGKRVVIGGVKDCNGELLPPNRVIYRDAFNDVRADVLYTYKKAGFEQDVILREPLAAPEEYGLNSRVVRLEIITEFLQPPAPRKELQRMGHLVDERLVFGAMHMGPGQAFLLVNMKPGSVVVTKSWQQLQGRDLLIEAVDYLAIKPYLDTLVAANGRKNQGKDTVKIAAVTKEFSLPARPPAAHAPAQTIQVASVLLPRPRETGVVIDYNLLSSASDVTLQGDTTYYVTGPITLSGTTTIEGGTVVKYASTNTPSLTLSGTVVCKTGSYQPAVFTAKDDNTIGAVISGSSGSPSGSYADTALILSQSNSVLQGMRIAYARQAIDYSGTSGHTLTDAQILKADNGLVMNTATNTVRNVLFYNVLTNFLGESFIANVEQTTFHIADSLAYDDLTNSVVNITNSLVVAVTNFNGLTYNTNATVVLSSDSGVFQTVGAAAHYLSDGSPYRDLGVTNLTTGLLGSLQRKTTYPPTVYSQGYITNSLTLFPAVRRDNDTPDLGYHYDTIDYAVGWMVLTNQSVLTVMPGTVIATFSPTNNTYGLLLSDGTQLSCEGTPVVPNRFVRYHTVQEQASSTWGATADPGIIGPTWATTNAPTVTVRFTEWWQMADGGDHFKAGNLISGMTPYSLRDCVFGGGGVSSAGASLAVTNCLFQRVGTTLTGTGAMNTSFMNNLFWNGVLTLHQGTNATVTVQNNLFDTVAIAETNTTANSYNGYFSTTALSGSSGGDVTLTNLTYQAGPLGNYYQPTNSLLINAGSVTNAGLAGFYHYTTTTNQVKEGTTPLDIGLHYIAVDGNGNPVDTDGDGVPDYIEDKNGNGGVDGSETNWLLKVAITRPKPGVIIP